MLAGCLVGTSVYGIHMNATVWENPYVSQDHVEVMPLDILGVMCFFFSHKVTHTDLLF